MIKHANISPFMNDFRVVVVLVELRPIAIFVFKKCTKETQALNLVSKTDITLMRVSE